MSDFVFEKEDKPQTLIKVIGVGGGGCNAVDSMVDMGLVGVEFYSVNTDSQALENCKCMNKMLIGREVTGGMGAGGDPVKGEQAAVAERDLLAGMLQGGDMVFITSCLGGGTGTGAAPVIAELAKSLDLLTVAVVTKPFTFEGPQRKLRAQQGIERLRDYVDALIVVMNDKLLESVGPKTSLVESFGMVNNILAQGVKAISDLISKPGLVNADFQDVRAVMGDTGGAVLGVGIGKGENRASEAVKKACSATLQEKIVIDGAKRVLVSINGGEDLSLHEVNEAASLIYEAADPDANIIFSAVIDKNLTDEVLVTLIATGFGEEESKLAASARGTIQEKPPAPAAMMKPKRTSPDAATMSAEFSEHGAQDDSSEFDSADKPEKPSTHSFPIGGFPHDAVEANEGRTDDPEKPELFDMPKEDAPKDLLSSWRKESGEEDFDADSPPPAQSHSAAAGSALGPKDGDENNLEIPAILRRRKSFFS